MTIAELARAAGCSRFHFMRAFRRAYGVTPGQRLRVVRLLLKKEVLGAGAFETRNCRGAYETLKAKGVHFAGAPEELRRSTDL